MTTYDVLNSAAPRRPACSQGATLTKPRRFQIVKLEDRIAPASLLNLNLNLVIRDVSVTIEDVNVIVSGNVIQVGVLSGSMTGVVNSVVMAS